MRTCMNSLVGLEVVQIGKTPSTLIARVLIRLLLGHLQKTWIKMIYFKRGERVELRFFVRDGDNIKLRNSD